MLSLSKKKKMVFSALAATALAVPVSVLAVNKINSFEDTYAATMPASFTDQNFYDCVLAEFQSEFPNEAVASTGLTDAQLAKITEVVCDGENEADSAKISNTVGLSKMTALTKLNLRFQKITEIDVSKNTALTFINLPKNNISSIDVTKNTGLTLLAMPYNGLNEIDVSKNTALTYLDVSHNGISSLNLSNNVLLETLGVTYNSLSSLNLTSNVKLSQLYAGNNQIASLDLSKNTALTLIGLESNNLTSLDVTNNVALEKLGVQSNQLTSLDVSQNSNLTELKTDDILVQSDIAPLTLTPKITFSLSKLGFLEAAQNINNTDNYAYNSSNKVLTINNFGASNYAQVSSETVNRTYKLQIPDFLLFDANGGEGAPSSVICYAGTGLSSCSVTIPSDAPSRNGYQFKGYADTSDASSATYAAGSSVYLSEPRVMYAVWEEDDTDGGDDSSSTGDTDGDSDSDEEDVLVPNTSKGTTPDTGANTKAEENNSSVMTYVLPVMAVVLAGALFGKNRSKKHVKFER